MTLKKKEKKRLSRIEYESMDKGGERREVYRLTKTENGEQKDGIYGILKRVKTKTHKLT